MTIIIHFLGVQPHFQNLFWRANCSCGAGLSPVVDRGWRKWVEMTFKCLTERSFLPISPRIKFRSLMSKLTNSSVRRCATTTSLMPIRSRSSRATKPATIAQPPKESTRGFVTAPTMDQLKPTAREVSLLETLWSWQEQSAKSRVVLGQPLKS